MKYVTFWMDSAGTSMFYAEGLPDETGRVITYYAEMDDWMAGARGKPMKFVDRIIDEDHCVAEMHDLTLPPGKTLVFEMAHERRRTLRASPAPATTRPHADKTSEKGSDKTPKTQGR